MAKKMSMKELLEELKAQEAKVASLEQENIALKNKGVRSKFERVATEVILKEGQPIMALSLKRDTQSKAGDRITINRFTVIPDYRLAQFEKNQAYVDDVLAHKEWATTYEDAVHETNPDGSPALNKDGKPVLMKVNGETMTRVVAAHYAPLSKGSFTIDLDDAPRVIEALEKLTGQE